MSVLLKIISFACLLSIATVNAEQADLRVWSAQKSRCSGALARQVQRLLETA